MDEFLSTLAKLWPFLTVAASGIFALWVRWDAREREARKDRTDLIKLAQDAAAGIIDELREELNRHKKAEDELRRRLDQLEGELTEVRKTHIAMMEAKDAKIMLLEGEVRRWKQYAESYAAKLEAAGIPHAKPEQTIWEAREEGLIMKPLSTEVAEK